jgi:hypothetical protein
MFHSVCSSPSSANVKALVENLSIQIPLTNKSTVMIPKEGDEVRNPLESFFLAFFLLVFLCILLYLFFVFPFFVLLDKILFLSSG